MGESKPGKRGDATGGLTSALPCIDAVPAACTLMLSLLPQENVRALTKGVQAVMGYKPGSGMVPAAAAASSENGAGKPWKKHGNRNKKEKSRRLYKHLDM